MKLVQVTGKSVNNINILRITPQDDNTETIKFLVDRMWGEVDLLN